MFYKYGGFNGDLSNRQEKKIPDLTVSKMLWK